MTLAVYDLTKLPTTYDFAAWCVNARTRGATRVHFIIDADIAHWKYPKEVAWARFGTILIPICKLAGLEYSVGRRMLGMEVPYTHGSVEQTYREAGRVEKLRSVLRSSSQGHVTITLRESFRNKYRNSNREAWERFAGYLEARGEKVVIFPECEHAPLNVLHRMAMYAGAKMNLGVANGPMALCIFSEAPYITLNQLPDPPTESREEVIDVRRLAEKVGFPEGSQYSFRNDRQILIYKPDTFGNIVEAYEAFYPRTEALAA